MYVSHSDNLWTISTKLCADAPLWVGEILIPLRISSHSRLWVTWITYICILRGATTQYWILYIDLEESYLIFSHHMQTNDLHLYIYNCTIKMVDIVFSLNHPNYARYMLLFRLKLLNIDFTYLVNLGRWSIIYQKNKSLSLQVSLT